MKNKGFLNKLFLLASPIAVILLGLLLVFNPDFASGFLSRVLGWMLCVIGIGFGVAAIVDGERILQRGIAAVLLVCIGATLSAKPLLLASWIGRIIGLLIALRGIRDLQGDWGQNHTLAWITIAVGVILVLLPMTTSRLVFSVCGLVVLFIGIGMLADRLRKQKQLPGGDDDNIIDAL